VGAPSDPRLIGIFAMLDLARARFDFLESSFGLRRTEDRPSLDNWLESVVPIRWSGERIEVLGLSYDRDRNLSFCLKRIGPRRWRIPRMVSVAAAYRARTGNRLTDGYDAEGSEEMRPCSRTAAMIERAAPFLKVEMPALVQGDYRLLTEARRWQRTEARSSPR
jgi:hypothetical protein